MSTVPFSKKLTGQLTKAFGTTELDQLLVPLKKLIASDSHIASFTPEQKTELAESIKKLEGMSELFHQVDRSYAQQDERIEIALRNIALSREELDAANMNLNTILNSLGQGFLLINLEGVCMPFYSAACEALLQSSPAGQPISSVLRIKAEEEDEFNAWLRLLLSEAIDFEDLSALAPTRYEHTEGRHIQLEFRAVRFMNGELRAVLLIATDRTEEAVAKKTVLEKERYVDRVIKMAKHRNEVFQFLEYMWKSAETIRKLGPDAASIENLDQVRRLLHTIKGGANTFLLDDLATDIHYAESTLIAPLDDYSSNEQLILRHLNKIRRDFSFLLGDPRHLGQTRIIYRSQIDKFLRAIETQPAAQSIRQIFLRTTLAVPIKSLVQHYVGMISDLSYKLNRKIAPLEVTSQADLSILPEPYQEVFTNLIHVFTNMVDHGIEPPDERVRKGKREEGKISLHFSEQLDESNQSKRLLIQISDDGAGVDPVKIRSACLKNGMVIPSEMSDKEIIQKIFDIGISSRQSVTQHSGRGIGLSALLRAVLHLGGRIDVTSVINEFTRFTIELPMLWTIPESSDSQVISIEPAPKATRPIAS